MIKTIALALLFLSGCTGRTVTRERPVEVFKPVLQPCVKNPRPALVMPLNQQLTKEQWDALDIKQKTEYVSQQGLDRQTYGEQLNAATGACP